VALELEADYVWMMSGELGLALSTSEEQDGSVGLNELGSYRIGAAITYPLNIYHVVYPLSITYLSIRVSILRIPSLITLITSLPFK
jgi:hypothetical protein